MNRLLAACAAILAVGAIALAADEPPAPARTRVIERPVRHSPFSLHNETVPSSRDPRFSEHAVFRSGGCGVERWAVKTLTDPAASQVTLAIQGSSVADLASIAPPVGPTDRVNPTEETEFQVQGTLTLAKPESDGDYHLVIDDGAGHTMIAESPDPRCAAGSPVIAQLEQVRAQLDAQLPGLSRGEALRPDEAAIVDGVGFFDRVHGQTGVAPNGIELHPILHIILAPQVGADRTQLTRLKGAPGSD